MPHDGHVHTPPPVAPEKPTTPVPPTKQSAAEEPVAGQPHEDHSTCPPGDEENCEALTPAPDPVETPDPVPAAAVASAPMAAPVRRGKGNGIKVTRPDLAAAPEAPKAPVLQPVATEDVPVSILRPPYSADGVRVTDADGKTLCICASALPWDRRVANAATIAALMNDHAAKVASA